LRVLLIEDDRTIGAAVADHIAAAGHAVDWARDLRTARAFLDVAGYELVLLDLTLPDGNGLSVLRSLRKAGSSAAIIILSAMDQVAIRIEGLNAGADDYLTKPFDLGELSARVEAVARRYNGRAVSVRQVGEAQIDFANRTARHGDVSLDIAAREWTVLERLTRTRGAVVAKSAIEDALYAFGSEVGSNTVEVYVSRLRKKLGKEAITTIRGLGYKVPERNG